MGNADPNNPTGIRAIANMVNGDMRRILYSGIGKKDSEEYINTLADPVAQAAKYMKIENLLQLSNSPEEFQNALSKAGFAVDGKIASNVYKGLRGPGSGGQGAVFKDNVSAIENSYYTAAGLRNQYENVSEKVMNSKEFATTVNDQHFKYLTYNELSAEEREAADFKGKE